MTDFAPGMRIIIRDEEWMVKKTEINSLGNKVLYCVGISPLVKEKETIFLTDLEQVQIVDPAEVKLIPDNSPFYKRGLLYLESQWRQKIPTDTNLHIGHRAAMDLMPYQLDPTAIADPQNYTPEDIKGLCIRWFKKDVEDQVRGSFLERKITLEQSHTST